MTVLPIVSNADAWETRLDSLCSRQEALCSREEGGGQKGKGRGGRRRLNTYQSISCMKLIVTVLPIVSNAEAGETMLDSLCSIRMMR